MKKGVLIKIFVNILTSARVLGALVIIPIYFKWGGFVAAITSSALFITDFLDGLLARCFHVQSFFGSIIDGLSDKLLGISILIVLALIKPLYLIPIILEIGILVVNVISIKMGNNAKTSFKGKIKTNILDIVLVIGLLSIALDSIPANKVFNIITLILDSFATDRILSIIIIPLLISELLVIIDYIVKAHKNTFAKKQKSEVKIIRKKTRKELLHDLFDTDFYLKHRNDNIKELFYITK